ncbi:MAG: tRNA1(Val) (adenine(37)-N6)-methyltransferase [Lachnospiraceae bacterium]|nr:tRNA1(Val) (adenine(37)-N6)-methyltransferase [Lachnospiraceae bacterium]
MQVTLRETERIDDLQRNNLKIIQDPSKFCFGMDAVLLSGFASVKAGEKAIDLGTGTGIIPLLLSAKTDGDHFTGLEIQADMAEMAARSVAMNDLIERITIDCGDIKEASEKYGASSFDVVTSNPPYMIGGHGLQNPESAKAIARHEVKCTLDDIVRETASLLVPHGRCYFVHRPFRLVDLFVSMRNYGIEPKRMRLVYPYADREPNMVLVEGARGGNPRLAVEKPLVVYNPDGSYTDEIVEIYSF